MGFEKGEGCGLGIVEGGLMLGCDLVGNVGATDQRC